MQAHDDVPPEEQKQEETPHKVGEGGDGDPGQRRPGESRQE